MSKALTEDQMEARLRVLGEHLQAENAHDVNAIMETFAENAKLILNGKAFADHNRIRRLHEELGFGEQGGFSDLRVDERQRYISDEAIILEQVLSGKHTNTWEGIAATGRAVEVPVCTVYRFDPVGKLASENVYFDRALLLKQLGVLS
jgi:hypothetical protein